MNVETKQVKLSELKLNPDNPRRIGNKEMERLVKSLQEFPDMLSIREIVVDETMTVLGGNMRLLALKKSGVKECTAKIVTGLTPEQKREFIIKDNSAFGEWDMDLLSSSWGDLPLVEWGVDLPEDWLNPGGGDGGQQTGSGNLADRFGVPPFSVLNAREGWWQDRKAAWIALGIKSELGRGGGHGTPPHPPTVTQNADGTLNYTGTTGQAERFDRQRQQGGQAPGGSPRPACDYSKKQRGDGRGRPI